MPMDQKVFDDLQSEVMSDFHKSMLQSSKALVKISRDSMSKNYAKWDHNDEVYNITRNADEQDKKARERKEPEKTLIPVTYSQVQTFVSFCFSLYTQREKFFELLGNNQESQVAAKLAEALVSRDLQHNVFEQKLYQFLLDIGRFGVGVFKTSWTRETQRVRTTVEKPPVFSLFGFGVGGGSYESIQEQTKYLGNLITNISPYRFFPDTRLPLTRFQEGEFCASEDVVTHTSLKQMEANKEVSGTKWLKPMSTKMLEDRGQSRLYNADVQTDNVTNTSTGGAQTKGTYVLIEVQRIIVPSEYKINGKPMGTEDYPVKYLIQYVNDQRVVRCEPLNYLHDQFTYDVAEFNPDMHRAISGSLADSIDSLQSIITWFINSRITSVRKVISNSLVVDPEGVEMKDLQDRNPIIRLKPTAAGRGVERFVKQLNIQDVTQHHIEDAKFLQDLTQLTTGINDNLLGQFNSGRRSATEARNVNSSAAARLKMLAVIIFYMALEPMGQKMVSNLRDGLDEETIVKLSGIDGIEGIPDFKKVSRSDLVGSYDFEVFDGTLPSEKGLIAQVLENILLALMKNPAAAISLGIDPKAILLESMELRGVRNPRRFLLKGVPQAGSGQPQIGPDGQSIAAATPGGPPTGVPQPTAAANPNGQPSAGGGIADLIQA